MRKINPKAVLYLKTRKKRKVLVTCNKFVFVFRSRKCWNRPSIKRISKVKKNKLGIFVTFDSNSKSLEE
jgi:hypothetical protein